MPRKSLQFEKFGQVNILHINAKRTPINAFTCIFITSNVTNNTAVHPSENTRTGVTKHFHIPMAQCPHRDAAVKNRLNQQVATQQLHIYYIKESEYPQPAQTLCACQQAHTAINIFMPRTTASAVLSKHMIFNELRNRAFCLAKCAVLQAKTGHIAVRNVPFRNAPR